MFRTTIVVKQGGPLSPKLFSIYVEDLISDLLKNTGQCKINKTNTGVIMYAYDLKILCESPESLNKMLRTCTEYGE